MIMKKLLFTGWMIMIALVLHAQEQVKVMSFNIRLDVTSDGENRWDARKDRVAGLVNYYEPDFLGAQEVMQHQLNYMLEKTNRYSFIGVGRDDGNTKGEYSCIFYRRDKYKLMEQSTFWLSPTPDRVSKGWDAAIVRVCTYGLFRSKKTKQYFWVFNTHFDHIGEQARLESAKLIFSKIQSVNKKNYPVIVTGDFNSKPDAAPAQYMMANMNDARNISELRYGNADTWNGFKFHEKPEGCIDYIFTAKDKRISVLKFATITDSYDMKYPSDHFPIMATINIKK
jgi:endonuclease/exonuclease/phosphatase family metal-dependent hydrolase